jgi:D-serine deaminase-like pyridoxal phosphate-dependent protein
MVVREEALQHNIDLLASYCRARGALLAPHAKTTMSPQIVRRQLAAGAWGVTVASVAQARALGASAGRRILIANEVIDPASIQWLASVARQNELKVYCYVDSVSGVRALADGVSGGVLDVLLEVGLPGGRCGVRSLEQARLIAAEVANAPSLRLVGVAAFEGIIGADRRTPDSETNVRLFLREVHGCAANLFAEGAFEGAEELILSAGGSAYFDLVIDELSHPIPRVTSKIVIRSGCYVTHDHGAIDRLTPFHSPQATFKAAIEVLGTVISCPEPDVAICDVGRRDVSFDAGLPVVLWVSDRSGSKRHADGVELTRLNDQHGYLRVKSGSVQVGDVLGLGISHPCTAFDKWRLIPLVDERLVIRQFVETAF